MRWHTSPEALSWRELDGELVVRNAQSGNTHLLDALPGKVLHILLESNETMSAAEIARRLPDAGELSELLAELERIGLVTRVD